MFDAETTMRFVHQNKANQLVIGLAHNEVPFLYFLDTPVLTYHYPVESPQPRVSLV